MALFETIKQWMGFDKQQLSYVIATVVTPWSVGKIKEIVPYWASHEFLTITKEPTVSQALLKDLNWTENELKQAIQLADIQFFKHFPLVGFLIIKEKLVELQHLPWIEYVYEVSVDMGFAYLDIIKGLHYVIEFNESGKKPEIRVVNMSLQPLEPYPFHEKEAMNIATRILTERGIVVVIAAGNYGDRGNNTLNPWSVAPWVIGVGATYPDGKRLWESSSRGIPNDLLYHPTVVASGVDIVSARSPEGIYEAVDPQGRYTIASGTSFATPQISGISARTIQFIREGLAISPSISEWWHLTESKFGVKVCPIVSSPDVIKRMIEDMAIEMPGYERHEVGVGFVNNDIATKYFESFKLSNFIKIFAFAEGGK